MQLFSLSCIFILDDNGDNMYNNAVVIVVVYFFGTTTGTTYTTMQLFSLLKFLFSPFRLFVYICTAR